MGESEAPPSDVPLVAPGTWVDVPASSPFPVHNLPFGRARRPDGTTGTFVAIGDLALDLAAAVRTGFFGDTLAGSGLVADDVALNGLAAAGRATHSAIRCELVEMFTEPSNESRVAPSLVPAADLTMLLPVDVGDYVDFYSSLHHATNLGRLFRPDGEALLPNWRQLPVGYHGRSGTIVADHSDIHRPSGLHLVDGTAQFGPTSSLDIELEVGFVVGAGSRLGCPIATTDADEHLFGLCLVNDWSARDIQAFEYQPLGPFLGKSFATSMSPWIITLDALEPFRVDPPAQDPPVAPYLRTTGATGFDLHLEVLLESATMRAGGIDPIAISTTGFADMYWSAAQQLAHLTANGASVRPGDLFASGTVSGATPGSEGSLIELTWRGERPIELPDGSTRTFLADGDRVTLRGWAGSDPATRIGLGSVTGTIAAPPGACDNTASVTRKAR